VIGGHDLGLPGATSTHDPDVLLRCARVAWPKAVVESGDATALLPIGEALRSKWQVPTEVFIYATRDAYESWTTSGLTPENADKMVSLTFEADWISFVVSDARAETGAMVNAMIEAVGANRATFGVR
jgi:hypothetical protein